jgi:TolB-like protein/tetratricopeptide (TPR) repeat protein
VKWDPADWPTPSAATPAIAAPPTADAPLALPDKPSIAVLPFQNMSRDPEQEYFVDGLVEDIITALSRFKSLFVIARNSSFTYKGKSPDIRQVGRELGVRYVLEGSVRKAGGRVRITGQLIDTATGTHLWADRFDGSLEDVFELQDQVTTSVVGAIAPKLERAEMERARRKPVENLDAYDCFLRGMAEVYKQTVESWKAALQLFYRAIELDPDFPTPYAMAARSYAVLIQYGKAVDKDWTDAETRRLALRASAVGPDDAQALCWAGWALGSVCGDTATGAALIDQGLAINQNMAVGWQLRASVSVWQGQFETAIEQVARAMRLSPMDPEAFRSEHLMTLVSLLQGKYDDAAHWATKVQLHQLDLAAMKWVSAAAYALAGNIGEAQKVTMRLRELNPAASISRFKQNFHALQPQHREMIVEGLRLAGLPE